MATWQPRKRWVSRNALFYVGHGLGWGKKTLGKRRKYFWDGIPLPKFSGAPGGSCAAWCHAEPSVLTRRAISELRSGPRLCRQTWAVQGISGDWAPAICMPHGHRKYLAIRRTRGGPGRYSCPEEAPDIQETWGEVAMKQGMVTVVKARWEAL